MAIWARRLVALLFMVIGSSLTAATVDITPLIGSPQIDYPAYNFSWPFWPQLAIQWLLVGLGGGLIAASAMDLWPADNQPLTGGRLAMVWCGWFAFRAGLSLLGFVIFGTMGPLGMPQPIFRFALVNGAVSATVIAAAYLFRHRLSAPGRRRLHPVTVLIAAIFVESSIVLGVSLVGRLPVLDALERFWPFGAIVAVSLAILQGVSPKHAPQRSSSAS